MGPLQSMGERVATERGERGLYRAGVSWPLHVRAWLQRLGEWGLYRARVSGRLQSRGE
jgi:hypothetical protein